MGLGSVFNKLFERKTTTKTVETLTPEQKQLLNQLLGISSQYAPEVSGYMASVMRGETGLSPEAIEQYFQQGVLQPALQEWETYTKPQIEEQFGSRYHSSMKTKTLSRAFSDLMTNMEKTRAELGYQGILQNLQARMQAAGMLQGQLYQPLSVKAFDIIATQQASPFDILSQLGGTAGSLMAGYGYMTGGGTGTAAATNPKNRGTT